MAKLIRASAWRRMERPYTRKSKYRAKSYVRAVPVNKIVKFEMGDTSAKFKTQVLLRSDAQLNIRHNALEAGRKTTNKHLERKLGKKGYHFIIRPYPHHILRNNPLAAGAGADRMSTGMKKSFGKSVGIAARIKKDQPIFEVRVDKAHTEVAKVALHRAVSKFPCSCKLEVIQLPE